MTLKILVKTPGALTEICTPENPRPKVFRKHKSQRTNVLNNGDYLYHQQISVKTSSFRGQTDITFLVYSVLVSPVAVSFPKLTVSRPTDNGVEVWIRISVSLLLSIFVATFNIWWFFPFPLYHEFLRSDGLFSSLTVMSRGPGIYFLCLPNVLVAFCQDCTNLRFLKISTRENRTILKYVKTARSVLQIPNHLQRRSDPEYATFLTWVHCHFLTYVFLFPEEKFFPYS